MKMNSERKTALRHELISLLAIGGLIAMPALAMDPYPGQSSQVTAAYQLTGRVDGVVLAKDMIIIHDRVYTIAATVPVHEGKNLVSRNVLHKGMKLGFKLASGGANSTITEVWVLARR